MGGAQSKVVLKDTNQVTLEEFIAVVKDGAALEFGEEFCQCVMMSRNVIEEAFAENKKIYGVTTGFGENVRYTISQDDAEILQRNIVRSHSCAVGEPLKEVEVRAMMMMMILNLGNGHSGIRLETLDLIREMLNHRIVPFAPGEGSVGYLGVEAHIALTFMGEGYVMVDGKKTESRPVLEANGLRPVVYQCKEGLSLLNGSMTVTALALLALHEMTVAVKNAEVAGTLAFEALKGTIKALDPRILAAKHHTEQQGSGRNILRMLEHSEICEKYIDDKVQDPYLLRAMAQINGSVKRLVNEAHQVIVDEMHSSSDNPEVFKGEFQSDVLMCGNFDGSYVGSHCDMLCMAASIMGGLAERCIDRMVNRNLNGGLPAFLVANPGLNNGYMIPQYTAAGLLGEIRTLSHPSTIDSVSTCANQEDPVSMGYFAAKKACQVAEKLKYMVAIEYMVALQAVDFLKPLKQAPVTGKVHDALREKIPFLDEDRYIYPDIEYLYEQISNQSILEIVEKELGKLEF